MKRGLMMIAMSALLMIGLSAFAQEQQAPPPGGEGGGQGRRGGMMASPADRADRLAKQLNLTDDQKAKVQKIYEDAQKDMQGMQGASREERQEKMKAVNEKVKAVLNDDQKKQFDEMQQRQRDRMRGGQGQGGQQTPPPQL